MQLEGDLYQMVSSLLQMHFTFPYLPVAHSRPVKDRVLSQPLCVWRWVEAVGWVWDLLWALIQPGRSNTDPHPHLRLPSSSQMLQLCTAASDENLIRGYWPPTSHPLLTVPLSADGKCSQEMGLSWEETLWGKWKTLFVFAQAAWKPGTQDDSHAGLIDSASSSRYLGLLHLSTCSRVAQCNVASTYRMLYVPSVVRLLFLSPPYGSMSEIYQDATCDGACYTEAPQAIFLFCAQTLPPITACQANENRLAVDAFFW